MLILDARWQCTPVYTLYIVRNAISACKCGQVTTFSKDMLDRVNKRVVDVCDNCFPYGVDTEILTDNEEYL